MKWIANSAGSRLIDEATPLRLTLLILLLRPPGEGALRGLTWLIAGFALIVPPFARWWLTWVALAGLVGARLVVDWPLSDNHIYLLGYWCLGVGLCLLLSSPFRALSDMSRWLVGATFLCAVVWKGVLAPDFLDARFFRITLITDERFADLSRAIGGLTPAQLEANRTALVALPQGAEMLDGPILVEPPALRRLGLTLTWGGFALEAMLAWAFLIPWPAPVHASRHLFLLMFTCVIYAAAPVAGFGWLLAAMGLAQCQSSQRALQVAYVAAFAIVTIYAETPAVRFLLSALT